MGRLPRPVVVEGVARAQRGGGGARGRGGEGVGGMDSQHAAGIGDKNT